MNIYYNYKFFHVLIYNLDHRFKSLIFYILLLKREGLFDARAEAITKREYGFSVYFLQRFINPLKSIPDE